MILAPVSGRAGGKRHEGDYRLGTRAAAGRTQGHGDPPYESGLLEQAMEKIVSFDILAPHGIIVAESAADKTLPELFPPYSVYREYRYGKIKVTDCRRAGEETI